MLERCGECGRRLRIKSPCIEHGHKLCKKCCDLNHEECQYKLFCWCNFSG